jgi:hypothetical protein
MSKTSKTILLHLRTNLSERKILKRICVRLPLIVLAVGLLSAALPPSLRAQENYEIQVYGYEQVEPHHTMVELHSNFIFKGSKTAQNGLYPTNRQLHETIEITHGFKDWFETGFYVFTSAQNGHGLDWVGSHIRPRVRIPPKWKWPLGLSLSNEIGYQRRQFSEDTWTWEMRPIVDKQIGKWYLAFNPTFDRSFHGPSVGQGFDFSPNFKFSRQFSKKLSGGLEYYGALGPATNLLAIPRQQHQLFPVVDLDLAPNWELNFGIGVGLTGSTDHLIAKMILGYRFNF